MPGDDHALDTFSAARSASTDFFCFDASGGVYSVRAWTLKTQTRGDDGVDARRGRAVIRLIAGHADNLLARASVEDERRRVRVADDECLTRRRQRSDGRWTGRLLSRPLPSNGMHQSVAKGVRARHTGLRA